MTSLGKLLVLSIAAMAVIGCGGNPSPTQQGTVVSFTFTGAAPLAVATQTGGGSFAQTSLQAGNMVNLVLPEGTTRYAIAYVCGLGASGDEFIFEATVQDSVAPNLSCPGVVSNLGLATGSVDASAIAGTTNVLIAPGGSLSGTSGQFSFNMPVGNHDVAFLAFNNTGIGTALGVKIERSQSIPGAINGGNTVVFGAGDATIVQPGTINNVPSGFPQPGVLAQYHTANGAVFSLASGFEFGQPATYPAVPAAAVQSGDFYLFTTNTSNIPAFTQQVGTTQTTTSGGGPVTLTLPALWTYSGPTASALPTFTFNYSGFSGLPAVSYTAFLSWSTGTTSRNIINATATANFQNGATTVTIPDLTSLNGFFAPAPSGTVVSWIAEIDGGTAQQFIFAVNPPSNGSVSFVQNRGSYTEP